MRVMLALGSSALTQVIVAGTAPPSLLVEAITSVPVPLPHQASTTLRCLSLAVLTAGQGGTLYHSIQFYTTLPPLGYFTSLTYGIPYTTQLPYNPAQRPTKCPADRGLRAGQELKSN